MKQLSLLDLKTKKCGKCKIVKSVSEFSKNRTQKDRLDCYCKKCNKEFKS